jgi:hypothetical protein
MRDTEKNSDVVIDSTTGREALNPDPAASAKMIVDGIVEAKGLSLEPEVRREIEQSIAEDLEAQEKRVHARAEELFRKLKRDQS